MENKQTFLSGDIDKVVFDEAIKENPSLGKSVTGRDGRSHFYVKVCVVERIGITKFGKKAFLLKVKTPNGSKILGELLLCEGDLGQQQAQYQPQQAYQPQQPQPTYQPQPAQPQQPSFPIGQAQLNEDDFPF